MKVLQEQAEVGAEKAFFVNEHKKFHPCGEHTGTNSFYRLKECTLELLFTSCPA